MARVYPLTTDIDECENRTDNCSRDGEAPAECINLPGDFTCSCDHHIGYTLNTSDYASCEGQIFVVCRGYVYYVNSY